jgi:hypothetical protein
VAPVVVSTSTSLKVTLPWRESCSTIPAHRAVGDHEPPSFTQVFVQKRGCESFSTLTHVPPSDVSVVSHEASPSGVQSGQLTKPVPAACGAPPLAGITSIAGDPVP